MLTAWLLGLPIFNTTNRPQKQIREISEESARIFKTQHIIVDVKGKNAPFPETCRYANRILTNLRSGGRSSLFLWKAHVGLSSRRVPLAQVKFSQRGFIAVLREWGGAALNSLCRLLARASFSWYSWLSRPLNRRASLKRLPFPTPLSMRAF